MGENPQYLKQFAGVFIFTTNSFCTYKVKQKVHEKHYRKPKSIHV